ncbi:MAG: hypothetical protein AAGA15_13305 [Pseudomonadota bacterium]
MPNLHLPGNDDLAALGKAFDDMTDTLGTIREQVTAVADSQPDAAAFDTKVPGELGSAIESLRNANRERTRLQADQKQSFAKVEKLLAAVLHRYPVGGRRRHGARSVDGRRCAAL